MNPNRLFRECIVVVALLGCTALVGANPFMGEYKGTYHPDGNTTMEAFASSERIKEINVVYAKDYKVLNDLLIITRNFRKI